MGTLVLMRAYDVQYALVILACALAVGIDVRTRRIPNWLTAGLAITAFLIHALEGPEAILSALGACALVLACGSIVFTLHWMGGGDVKLAAAVALALGWPKTAQFGVATLIAGGVLALAASILRGQFMQLVRNLAIILRPAIYRSTMPELPAPSAAVPYAIAIAAGAVIAIAPSLRR